MLKVAVITVSDRASRGEYADLSGPRIREILDQRLPGADISLTVVAGRGGGDHGGDPSRTWTGITS